MILAVFVVASKQEENRQHFDKRIIPEIKNVLDNLYKDNPKLRDAILYTLNKEKHILIKSFYEPSLLNNPTELERRVLNCTQSYRVWFLSQRVLYDKFVEKTVQWYPHFIYFIQDLDDFLWRQKIFTDKFKQFTLSKRNLQTKLMPYFANFINFNPTIKQKINEAIGDHFKQVFKEKIKLSSPEIESMFEHFISNQNFSDFSLLFDRQKVVARLTKMNCEMNTTVKIKRLAQTYDETVKKHVNKNKCIAKEICSKKSVYDDEFLKKEMKIYIEAFESSIGEARFDTNEKIKDEIDESIYDVILKVLT